MKTCILFNTTNHRQENKAKIKLTHQNLTSQISSVSLPLKRAYLLFILKNRDFWCLFKNSKKYNGYLCTKGVTTMITPGER
jgi:hypothetical protein